MSDNPQLLVDQIVCNSENNENEDLPDAIFLPFKDRNLSVSDLLEEVSWYTGNIYLMPSTQSDIQFIKKLRNTNKYILTKVKQDFISFMNSLGTSNHRLNKYKFRWDLPTKRNYALYLSRLQGYKKILVLDDDIRGVSPIKLNKGTQLLDSYAISGCFVQDFPDTSVVGHLALVAGEVIYPFLSGSFLFIRPFDVHGFFPNIYNEDWLFMVAPILERSICSFGSIAQLPYDPFSNPKLATFQEFGDIIADGLYWLIEKKDFGRRHNIDFWQHFILEHRTYLCNLNNDKRTSLYKKIVNNALRVAALVTAEDCIRFIIDWEEDINKWQQFIKEATHD